MSKPKLPPEFVKLCKSVTAKRPKTGPEVESCERLKQRTLQPPRALLCDSNQLRRIAEVIANKDWWAFEAADFRATLGKVREGDFVYADPPYAGRHVDYFNSWSEKGENDLAELLKRLPCKFILSTWHSNQFRRNLLLEKTWIEPRFQLFTREHFYHVGSTEDLRHAMTEALVTNLSGTLCCCSA
jgi:DNA adenine methylase